MTQTDLFRGKKYYEVVEILNNSDILDSFSRKFSLNNLGDIIESGIFPEKFLDINAKGELIINSKFSKLLSKTKRHTSSLTLPYQGAGCPAGTSLATTYAKDNDTPIKLMSRVIFKYLLAVGGSFWEREII
jgi:hypothetical protein